MGEVFGVFDKYRSKGFFSEERFRVAIEDFSLESVKMVRLGSLQIWPITTDSLLNSWLLLLEHHIYIADPLQIATAKKLGCSLFLTSDTKLVQTARKEGIKALNIERDPEKALTTLREM